MKKMYQVKYKRGFFWKTLKGVVADSVIQEIGMRYFVFEDGSVLEVPLQNTLFWFSKEREAMIKKGQEVNSKEK